MSAKILIVEDQEPGFNAAVAGLIASEDDNEPNLLARRIQWSLGLYEIQRANGLDEAILKLDSFQPDLCIIDVNLPVISTKLQVQHIHDGIDLYQQYPFKNCVRILFSAMGGKGAYMRKIKPEERADFIHKSDGSGYEALSHFIGEYLYKMCAALCAQADPTGIDRFINKLSKGAAFKDIRTEEIAIGSRVLLLEDLFTYNNRIETGSTGPRLVNITSDTEAKAFLQQHKAEVSDRKNRKLFCKPAMLAFVAGFEDTMAEEQEAQVHQQAAQMIRQIMNKLSENPKTPIHTLINLVLPYRLKDYVDKNNLKSDFLRQFINGLAIRRTLVFFEQFYDKHIATKNFLLKERFEDFYDEFVTDIIQAVECNHNRPLRSSMSQRCENLNLGYQQFKEGHIERVCARDYVQYRAEPKWENSREYQFLTADGIRLMTR